MYRIVDFDFMLVALNGRADDVLRLIDSEKILERTASDGVAAMMLACMYGRTGVVQALGSAVPGVFSVSVSFGGRCESLLADVTQLSEAVASEDVDALRRLSVMRSEREGKGDHKAYFELACMRGHVNVIKAMGEMGKSVDWESATMVNALAVAEANGHAHVRDGLRGLGLKIPVKPTAPSTRVPRARQGAFGGNVDQQMCGWGFARVKVVRTLKEAVLANDHVRVRDYLCEGHDPNQYYNGEPLLSLAASQGTVEVVEALLSDGRVRVDGDGSRHPLPPLMQAARKGNLGVVKLLCDRGASVNVTAGVRTAILLAAKNGHTAVVRELRLRGARAIIPSHGNVSPLNSAVEHKHLSVVRELELIGVNPNAKGRDGRHPIIVAASNADVDMVEQLVKMGARLNVKTNKLETVLTAAIRSRSKLMVRRVLDLGAQVIPGTDRNLVAAGARCGDVSIIRDLCFRGADPFLPSHPTPSCPAALMIAAEGNFVDIARELQTRHVNPDMQIHGTGTTALMFAVQEGHLEIAAILRAMHADANIKDGRGSTALHHAMYCKPCCPDMVNLLLAMGARLDVEDKYQRQPIDVLLSWHDGRTGMDGKALEMCRFLLGAMSSQCSEEVLLRAMKHAIQEIVRDTLMQGLDMIEGLVNDADTLRIVASYGLLSLLRYAADGLQLDAPSCHYPSRLHPNADTTRRLLGMGADLCASDEQGWSVLMLALALGDKQLVEMVEASGAVLSSESDHLPRLLVSAAQQGDTWVVVRLLALGLDPNGVKEHGVMSPLQAAFSEANEDTMCTLLAAGAEVTQEVMKAESDFIDAWTTARCMRVLLRAGGTLHGNTFSIPLLLLSAVEGAVPRLPAQPHLSRLLYEEPATHEALQMLCFATSPDQEIGDFLSKTSLNCMRFIGDQSSHLSAGTKAAAMRGDGLACTALHTAETKASRDVVAAQMRTAGVSRSLLAALGGRSDLWDSIISASIGMIPTAGYRFAKLRAALDSHS